MGEVRDPRLSVGRQGNRASDVAQRPQREREVKHRRDAGVLSKAKRQIVVAPGLEQGQRAFQVIARFAYSPANQYVAPAQRWATQASGESGLGSTSPRKVSACALIADNSPRTKLPAHRP